MSTQRILDATNARFTFTTSDTLNAKGGYDILSLAGDVNGDAIVGLTANPDQPEISTSTDTLFYYDNVFYSADAPVDLSGILFTTASGLEYNFWVDTAYHLDSAVETAPGTWSYGVASIGYIGDGTPSSALPEPTGWAMMMVGFGLAGAAMRRRRAIVRFA